MAIRIKMKGMEIVCDTTQEVSEILRKVNRKNDVKRSYSHPNLNYDVDAKMLNEKIKSKGLDTDNGRSLPKEAVSDISKCQSVSQLYDVALKYHRTLDSVITKWYDLKRGGK